jgi:hypothetical protein
MKQLSIKKTKKMLKVKKVKRGVPLCLKCGTKSTNLTLNSFVDYCNKHQSERFWQALRNWSGARFILKAKRFNMDKNEWEEIQDTFHFD